MCACHQIYTELFFFFCQPHYVQNKVFVGLEQAMGVLQDGGEY